MRTYRYRARFYAMCATLIAALAGCASTEPDVVATQESVKPDGNLPPIPIILPCQGGRYTGTFANLAGTDTAPTSTLNGTMSFSLVQVASGTGEFFKIQNGAKLAGKSAQGDTFSADIDSDNSGCHEGRFNVTLANGLFRVRGADAGTLQFGGTVDGVYTAYKGQQGEFSGSWRVYWPTYRDGGTPFLHGGWTATWSGAN